MGKLSYPYLSYAGDGGSPSLEVTLLGTNGYEHQTLALIDTGAEWSILPTPLAVELGAELGSEFCQPTHTQHAGGLSQVHWWSGASDVAQREELRVRFGDFEAPLAPILEPGITVVVLGRTDFLVSELPPDYRPARTTVFAGALQGACKPSGTGRAETSSRLARAAPGLKVDSPRRACHTERQQPATLSGCLYL